MQYSNPRSEFFVLNAFRHLRSIHGANPSFKAAITGCSTPFGISDPFTLVLLRCEDLYWKCSTPFGISDPFTHEWFPKCYRYFECSTPFGISDPFTYRRRVPLNLKAMCSTPFGISDPFTDNCPTAGTKTGPVLNAFRHLRSIHRPGGV